jgi:hypothetical protein
VICPSGQFVAGKARDHAAMQSARRAIDAMAANDPCAMQTRGVRQVRCPLIGVSRTCALDGARSEKCRKPNYAGQRAVRLGDKSDLPKFVLLASAPSKLPEMQQAVPMAPRSPRHTSLASVALARLAET